MGVKSAISVAKLVGKLSEVEGRKRLQKIVHLLGASGAREFRHRFVLHYFGPFSRELAADLDFLQAAELLLEKAPPEGTSGAYVYTLPSSEDVEERLRTLSPQPGDSTPAWVDLAAKLNQADTRTLEALSTVVFLGDLGNTGTALEQEFARVKPQLDYEFQPALKLGTELGLLPRPAGA